jgi:hypothetical protein
MHLTTVICDQCGAEIQDKHTARTVLISYANGVQVTPEFELCASCAEPLEQLGTGKAD